MIKATFDTPIKLAHLELEDECEQTHILTASETINQFVSEGAELTSLMLSVEKYDHWESFGQLTDNFLIDENVLSQIKKVAIVTNNPVFETGTNLSALFSSAKLSIYSYCEYDQAMAWLADLTEVEESV